MPSTKGSEGDNPPCTQKTELSTSAAKGRYVKTSIILFQTL